MNKAFLRAAVAAATLTTGAIALAHSGATGIVKTRMDLMKSVADQMKTIGNMVKGAEKYDADQVANAAATIADHAEKIPEMFPDGSIEGPSEALPVIWQDWETFKTITNDMRQKARKLGDVASQSSDVKEIQPYFAALGKTCVACHEDFRQKKQ